MKKRNILGTLFLVLALLTLIAGTIFSVSAFTQPRPEDYKIDLSDFPGRILPPSEVETGTFTIQIPFEEIQTKDAIMTWETSPDDEIGLDHCLIKVWRPDSLTSGIFQYSEKLFVLPETWRYHVVSGAILSGKTLSVIPKPDASIRVLACFIVFIGLVLGLFTKLAFAGKL